jgi:hypothetical protein
MTVRRCMACVAVAALACVPLTWLTRAADWETMSFRLDEGGCDLEKAPTRAWLATTAVAR